MKTIIRRLTFLKAKVFCILYGYPVPAAYITAVIMFWIISLIDNDISFGGILLCPFLIVFFIKRRTILKCGCLQLLVKDQNRYELTMCGGLANKKPREIIELFHQSFQMLYGNNIFLKSSRKTVYTNTHNQFARSVLNLLFKEEKYSKQMFEVDAQKGVIQIRGYKVIIQTQNKRKNRMLASAYPFGADEEKLREFVEKNIPEDFTY